MALAQSDILTLLGVVVILVGMLFLNALMARRPTARPETPETDTNMLCKFVTHNGSVVGETVAVEGDQVILKQAGVFKAVALAQLHPDGAEYVLRGDVDWAEAETAGATWYAAVKGDGVEEVAGELTRSEDVRAPALKAFEERHADESSDGEEE